MNAPPPTLAEALNHEGLRQILRRPDVRNLAIALCLQAGRDEPEIESALRDAGAWDEKALADGRRVKDMGRANWGLWASVTGRWGDGLRAALTAPGSNADDAVEPGAIVLEPPATAQPKGGRSERLPVIYAHDIAKPVPPLKWLSRSFGLIQGRVLAFTGYGDAGKTFAAMDLALAVALGASKALGGMDVGLSGAVAHVDFEQQELVTRWRYQRLARGRALDLATLGERLALVSLPPLKLTSGDAETELTRLCTGKALAIVDNLTAGCPGVDQNSTAIAEPLYMLGRVSAATGCTVIVILHDNKTPNDGPGNRPRAQQIRGSGAIHAALGGGLGFRKSDTGIITYESIKETMGPKPSPEFFRIEDVGEVDPNSSRSVGLRLEWIPSEQAAHEHDAHAKALVARVCDYVRAHPDEASGAKLAREWGIRPASVAEAIKTAESSGAIVNHGSPSRPKWRVAE